jgi:hypothetical protein
MEACEYGKIISNVWLPFCVTDDGIVDGREQFSIVCVPIDHPFSVENKIYYFVARASSRAMAKITCQALYVQYGLDVNKFINDFIKN